MDLVFEDIEGQELSLLTQLADLRNNFSYDDDIIFHSTLT